MYSRSFIKLWLNHWCHMVYFTDVFTTFLCLDRGSTLAVYGRSENSRISLKYLNLCSEDEQRFYVFGTTWGGWVINDNILIFGWTIPLTLPSQLGIPICCKMSWFVQEPRMCAKAPKFHPKWWCYCPTENHKCRGLWMCEKEGRITSTPSASDLCGIYLDNRIKSDRKTNPIGPDNVLA